MVVKNIIIGVVVILLIIVIVRWLMGDSSKLSGLNDAKKVTKISAALLGKAREKGVSHLSLRS